MNTKTLSPQALVVIDRYVHFTIGTSVCSIPYYNNRHEKARARLRVETGKGSPEDIFDEVESLSRTEKISVNSIDSVSLKRFLIDHNIGIDCSGFAYYVMNAENESRGKGTLPHHLKFPLSKGLVGIIRTKMRPVENAGVTTFASNENSSVILTKDTEPGDMITMVGGPDDGERNHILIIHQIDYSDSVPIKIYYTHAVAWPTDGEYGHGVRQGYIEILNAERPLTEQKWTEAEKIGEENYTHTRALKSKTEIRRLNWF